MTQDDAFTEDQTVHTELPPIPHPTLHCLDVLIGSWDVTGQVDISGEQIHGKVDYMWLDGGFFLIQQIDLIRSDVLMKAIEYIGYDSPSNTLRSHYFDNVGSILENVWELTDHTLTIWAGQIGAAASFKSKFSDDHNEIMGRWEWPGGGYALHMRRIPQPLSHFL